MIIKVKISELKEENTLFNVTKFRANETRQSRTPQNRGGRWGWVHFVFPVNDRAIPVLLFVIFISLFI